MRDEGPYCLEWIAHHRAAGATQFLIFTHDCTDRTDALLDLIPGVTHVPFTPEPKKSVQWQAMRLAERHDLVRRADWVLFMDCDEFVCLAPPLAGLPDLIAALPDDTEAIALPWRFFGSSGLLEYQDAPVTDRFKRCAPDPFHLPAGHFFKTLYRPDRFRKMGVHRPRNRSGASPVWALGGDQVADIAFAENDSRINLFGLPVARGARLNHYSLKSAAEFMVKRTRGLPNRSTKSLDLGYWAERNFNTVEDRAIEAMLPATREDLQGLMDRRELCDLHEASVQHHRAAFHAIIQDARAVQFFWHLALLTGSTPPDIDTTKGHLARLAQL
jgi:hypothetical protein